MSFGYDRGNMWRQASSSTSSRLTALKSLVPAQQRDAVRSFFDRRVPSHPNGNVNPNARSLDASTSGFTDINVEQQPQDRKQTWREWAGDKIRSRASSVNGAVDKITLFPGWASKRYHNAGVKDEDEPDAFSLEVYVAGFAASHVPPEAATRSQRAFIRLAKAYASLPKLPSSSEQAQGYGSRQISRSTEDLLKSVDLPPPPSEMTEEMELAQLEKQFQKAELDVENGRYNSFDSYMRKGSPSGYDTPTSSASSVSSMPYVSHSPMPQLSSADITRLHENLHIRLQPFWYRSLSGRTVKISIYCRNPEQKKRWRNLLEDTDEDSDTEDPSREPITTVEVTTDDQGAFSSKISIPWDTLCRHPGALHIAFGDANQEHELYICTDLFSSPPKQPNPYFKPERTARSVLPVSLNHSRVRLISDIDDTIKLSNIIGGVKKIFQNVFVKGLEETVIEGMGEWYTNMCSRGVRFHYVSNSPYELLPIIIEFIKIAGLPSGSIKLRSYAVRSFFNGLESSPAHRKEGGIRDILNAFSDSRFFLVGDSGEQDLELYAQLASERHQQILAVFIRDASAGNDDHVPIDDPTGEEIKRRPSAFLRSGPLTPGSVSSNQAPFFSSGDLVQTPMSGSPTQHQTPTQKSYTARPAPQTPTLSELARDEYFSSTQETGFFTPRAPQHRSSTSSTVSAPSPTVHSPRPRAPATSYRYASDPTPSSGRSTPHKLSLPSNNLDPIIPTPPSTLTPSPLTSRTASPSPSSSRQPSPTPSIDTTTLFPGSLSKAELQNLPAAQRRRVELQERVYRARLKIPSHVPLRVFTKPEECVEAERILGEIGGATDRAPNMLGGHSSKGSRGSSSWR